MTVIRMSDINTTVIFIILILVIIILTVKIIFLYLLFLLFFLPNIINKILDRKIKQKNT